MTLAGRLSPLALLVLAGCISLGPKTPPSLIRLSPSEMAPADAGEPLTPARSITVSAPSAPNDLAVPRVPVTNGPRVAYLKDAQYADLPTRLFGNLLAETIRARTGRPVLDGRDYHLAPGTRLTTRIIRLNVDADRRQVDMIVDAGLFPVGNATPTTRRFEAHVPVSAIDAAAVSPALGQAANTVAQQIADWIGR